MKLIAAALAVAGALSFGAAFAGTDHSTLINGPFKTGPDVTKQCLQCHQKQAQDFMKTVHWTWSSRQKTDAQGEVNLGKVNAVNNFCIALPSNEPRCTSCHAGYGWKDASFDFGKAENIDCLVCHDTTGKYKKFPTAARAPDLRAAGIPAQVRHDVAAAGPRGDRQGGRHAGPRTIAAPATSSAAAATTSSTATSTVRWPSRRARWTSTWRSTART